MSCSPRWWRARWSQGGTSHEGEAFLIESKAREAYFPLSIHFVTQKTQTYCGVASIVMVLNALNVPATSTPEYEPYHTFTQDNVLDGATDGVLPRDVLARQGMTLDQLGALLALHPIAVEVHHAADTTLDAFRATASAALESGDRFVIVNFLRKAIGEQISGHISPLAAYDAKEDNSSSWMSRATNIRRCGSRRPTCSAP